MAPRGLPTWSSGASEIGARGRRDSSRDSSRGSSRASSRPRPWGGAWEDGPSVGCCWSAGSAGDATGPASYASMLLRNATHTVMSAAAARDSSPLLLPQAPPASSPAPWLYSAPRKRCVCGMQGVQGGGARLSVRLPLRMPGMLSGRLLMRRFPGPCASRRASRVACRQGERARVRVGDKESGEGVGAGAIQ